MLELTDCEISIDKTADNYICGNLAADNVVRQLHGTPWFVKRKAIEKCEDRLSIYADSLKCCAGNLRAKLTIVILSRKRKT